MQFATKQIKSVKLQPIGNSIHVAKFPGLFEILTVFHHEGRVCLRVIVQPDDPFDIVRHFVVLISDQTTDEPHVNRDNYLGSVVCANPGSNTGLIHHVFRQF